MRPNWVGVNSEQRYGNESTVSSETQNSIPQLEGVGMFLRIILVKVYVLTYALVILCRDGEKGSGSRKCHSLH